MCNGVPRQALDAERERDRVQRLTERESRGGPRKAACRNPDAALRRDRGGDRPVASAPGDAFSVSLVNLLINLPALDATVGLQAGEPLKEEVESSCSNLTLVRVRSESPPFEGLGPVARSLIGVLHLVVQSKEILTSRTRAFGSCPRRHGPPFSLVNTRGSIAAALSTPPNSAPAIPGVITSCPDRNSPGTGVRGRSASDKTRRGVTSSP